MKPITSRSRAVGYGSLLLALLFSLLSAARLQAVSDFLFTKHSIDTTFDQPLALDLADMDSDSDLDVLAVAYTGDDLSWWENTAGDGTVWSEHVVADNYDGAHGVQAADIDGDGDLDVIGAADLADDVTWWENTNGSATAWESRTIDGDLDGARTVYAADVEGDGDLDVVAGGYNADDVIWYDNTAGDGSGWIKRTINDAFDGVHSVTAADVDGDGDMDVLAAANLADDVAWWENVNGNGLTWTLHTISSFFDGARQVRAVDLDADGDVDVLAAGYDADDVTWWENDLGDGLTWTTQTIDGAFDGAIAVYPADVDDDGDLDVLAGALNADDVTWWENLVGSGDAWSEHLVTDFFDGVRWVAAADLDGDNDTDIVAVAENVDEVAWWEKTTAWIAHTIDATFDGAYTIATADVDGDGHLDVLGAATDADSLAWWQNASGDGFYWTRRIVTGDFNGATGVAGGDLDGDGDTDVLGAAFLDDTIGWWENLDGGGLNWNEHVISGSFDGAHAVATADLDGDGDLDVLGAARLGDQVTWWENVNGDGDTWAEHPLAGAFEGAYTVIASDVNQDGYLDVVGVAYDDRNVTWWENELGDGSLWIAHLVTGNLTGVTSVAVADLDRDSDLDILTSGEKVDAVVWWENNDGSGTSWRQNLISSVVDGASSVAISDVDGDSDPDILATANVANTLTLWKNSFGDGTFWFIEDVASSFTGARSLLTADVDGDGDQDLLAIANGLNTITWWEQERAPWKAHLVQANFPGATAVEAADVDGDKNMDIVAVGETANGVAWWHNVLGDGILWQARRVDGTFAGARAVTAADLNADGHLDIVGAADQADSLTWWSNKFGDGLTWTENTIDSAFDGAAAVDAADLDGDGDLDVLGAARWADTVAWWQNVDGDGLTWTKVTIDTAFDGAVSAQAADVDGDGDLDVLGAANSDDEVAWWQNSDGSGLSWLKYTVATGFDGAQSAAAGDLDGDGYLDIVGAARWSNQVTWWRNTDGAGATWTAVILSDDFGGAYAVTVADVDSDGDLDVLGAATDGDAIKWLENRNGDGSLWTERAIGIRFDGARGVAAGDFDGDTDMDILGAASGSGTLGWWENTGDLPPNFTLTASPASANICAPAGATFTMSLDAITGFSQPVDLSAAGHPSGSTVTFAPNPVTPPGSSTMTVGNTGAAAGGNYTIEITGMTPTRTHTATVGLNLYTASPIAPTLVEPANGSVNQSLQPTFSWTADLALTYDLDIAVDANFSDIVYSVTGLTETSHTPTLSLDEDSVYYWRVRATNTCGTGSYSSTYVFTTEPPVGVCPAGTTPTAVFSDGFETGAGGWTHSGAGDTWILSNDRPYTGSFAYHATDVEDITDQLLVSPEVILPTDQGPLTLQYWNYQAIEHRAIGGCFDGAILEISTDGGATYNQLIDELQTDPYDGLIYSSSGNPLGGLAGWCGDVQDWTQSIIDLDAYAGQPVKFRFRLGTDTSSGREGWYLDDLVVQSCTSNDADFTVEATPASQSVCAPTTPVYDVVVTSILGFQTPVNLTVSGEPAGTTPTFSPNPVTPPGTSQLTLGNTSAATAGHYTLDILGTAAARTRTASVELDLYTGAPIPPALLTPPDGATSQSVRPVFTWGTADQATSYDIEIATDSGFTNIVESASGLTGNTFIPDVNLALGATHYWRVRANNICGPGVYSTVYSFLTQPAVGQCTTGDPVIAWSDDFETGGGYGWTHSGTNDTWTLSTQRPHNGIYSYKATDVATVSDQMLMSPALIVPAGQYAPTLLYWNYQSIEDRTAGGCFDGGILEISNDGGLTWSQMLAELLTDPYDGVVFGTSNPLYNLNAWCGDPQDWLQSAVNLDAYAGQTVQFRFRLGTDQSAGREGWYIDEVVLQSCQP
ncbi:MAG: FG-GAP-like repeat-containing protein [Chloroflexota bacterium]